MRRSYTVILLICFCVILCGCETQQQKEQKVLKDKEEAIKAEKEMNEYSFRREAVLLSLKYRIEEERVFNLLVDDQGITEENIETLADDIGGKNMRKRIEKYSNKYDIPQDVISSILIDYEIMHNTHSTD